jgi:membrane protein implicated in regulation of membrane protease activity
MLIVVAIVLLLLLPSPWNLVAFIVLTVLWIGELFAWHATVKKRRRVVGAQTLIGREAVVSTACRPVGQVRLDGEIWQARCDEGADVGDRVRIVGRERLTLAVEPVADELPA